MTIEIFTNTTIGITELKVNPIQVADHDVVCVLSRSKPVFYTVTPERMEELLYAEEQFENLNNLEPINEQQHTKPR